MRLRNLGTTLALTLVRYSLATHIGWITTHRPVFCIAALPSSEHGAAFSLPQTAMPNKSIFTVNQDNNAPEFDLLAERRFEFTFSFGDMTDGGSTTGTIVLPVTIPAGALFRQTLLKAIIGFAGDTTATIQVGDGSDVDRYSTGTPSVFATAAGGVAAGAASGTNLHATAVSAVTVTITAGTDYGLVTAGTITIVLIWDE